MHTGETSQHSQHFFSLALKSVLLASEPSEAAAGLCCLAAMTGLTCLLLSCVWVGGWEWGWGGRAVVTGETRSASLWRRHEFAVSYRTLLNGAAGSDTVRGRLMFRLNQFNEHRRLKSPSIGLAHCELTSCSIIHSSAFQ